MDFVCLLRVLTVGWVYWFVVCLFVCCCWIVWCGWFVLLYLLGLGFGLLVLFVIDSCYLFSICFCVLIVVFMLLLFCLWCLGFVR